MESHKAVGIIPARGGSRRIPKKNLAKVNGKPLIAYAIRSAQKSSLLMNDIYVSTQDLEITELSKKFGAKVIPRPKELASDKASTLSALQHSVKKLESEGLDFDTVVVLQPTSPFRRTQTIDLGIQLLWDNWQRFDAVFSVTKTKFPPSWMLRLNKDKLEFIYHNDFSKIRGQDLEKTYVFDGVLYVLKKDLVIKSKRYPFSQDRTGYLVCDKIESIDIDDVQDLEIAKAIGKYIKL